jgi:alpha-glucosidase
MERRFPLPQVRGNYPALTPGAPVEVTIDGQNVTCTFGERQLDVTVLDHNLFRLTWLPGDLPLPVGVVEQEWENPSFELIQEPGKVLICSATTQIEVQDTGEIGYWIVNRPSHQPARQAGRDLPPVFAGNSWELTSELSDQSVIYGTGMRAAALNLRGSRYRLWNRDPGGSYAAGDDPLYLNIPVYLTLDNGICVLRFFENSYSGKFDFSSQAISRFQNGALRYYVIVGGLSECLQQFTRLTGRPPLPPRWALGYHQSRWGYKSEAEIREIVRYFKEYDLPLDVIHLDIDYMSGYRVFSVDQDRFPDLGKLSADLLDQGIRLVTILDPGVKIDPHYAVYRLCLAENMYVATPSGKPTMGLVWPEECIFPDFCNPEASERWGELYPHLLDLGVAGFWHDMNEPATFAAWGDPSLPVNALHHVDGTTKTHAECHNLYGLGMNRAGYFALRKWNPEKRPWILSRSGWAGGQRFAWNWTGDIASSWEMLQLTLPSLLNMSMSGIYFAGSDIGGFSGHPDPELYVRWFQLAALTPFFRLHSATGLPPREPWTFGEEVLNIIRRVLKFRQQLLPYLYTLAYQAATSGLPLMRPMTWEKGLPVETQSLENQFFLGDHLLVAPVLEAGLEARQVGLPPGLWYAFLNGSGLPGPATIDIPVTLESMPLFLRGGSVIPLLEDNQPVLLIAIPHITSNYEASSSPVSLVYLDAGDGYGPFRLERYRFTYENGDLVLLCESEGDYRPDIDDYTLIFYGPEVETVVADGQPLTVQTNRVRLSRFSRLEIRLAK